MTRFRTVLADPPWAFECWNAKGGHKSASAHYDTQGIDFLASLPVKDILADDACLFVWACWPTLPDAFRLIEAWGFTYKTLGFNWVKCTGAGTARMGLGYWTRANTEPCLLGTRGKPQRMDKGVEQVIVSGLGEHSEKPEAQYERIERLVEGPYLELFHRPRNGLFPPRDGWTFVGNETTGNDIREDLRKLAEGELVTA